MKDIIWDAAAVAIIASRSRSIAWVQLSPGCVPAETSPNRDALPVGWKNRPPPQDVTASRNNAAACLLSGTRCSRPFLVLPSVILPRRFTSPAITHTGASPSRCSSATRAPQISVGHCAVRIAIIRMRFIASKRLPAWLSMPAHNAAISSSEGVRVLSTLCERRPMSLHGLAFTRR